VKSAILDENLTGVLATDHDSRQVQSLNVAFQRFPI
jgi:hypothetical protein